MQEALFLDFPAVRPHLLRHPPLHIRIATTATE